MLLIERFCTLQNRVNNSFQEAINPISILNMTYKEHFKQTVHLAIPMVIGQLGHMAMGVVDTVMIGRIGAVSLAAASLANALFTQFMIFGLGLSFALSPLVSQAKESRNHEKPHSLLEHSLMLNMLTGLVLLGFIFGAIKLLPFLGQEADVTRETIPYLKTLAWSLLPVMFFQTWRQFSDGFSIVKPAMFIILIANIINIFFNWLLIFGKWGFPQLNLLGAGISTLITRIFMALAMFIFVVNARPFKVYHPLKMRIHYHWHAIKEIIDLGIPSAFQAFFELAAFSGVAIMIGWLGAKPLAAHQIALNMAAVTFMFAMGISQASAIRVGGELGKGKNGHPRKAGFAALLLGAGVMGANGLIFILFRHTLVSWYIDDPVVQHLAAGLLIIAAIFQIFDGVQAVGVGILRGILDAKIPTLITFVAYWILSLPVGYLIGFKLGYGVNGVWIGFVSGLGSAATMLFLRFYRKCPQNGSN